VYGCFLLSLLSLKNFTAIPLFLLPPVLSQISEGASSTTSKPLTPNEFEERLRKMKEEHMNKSSTSEHDTSN
jgi:hypothetical protein